MANKDILFYSIHKIQKLKESLLSDNVYQDIPHSVIESLSVFLPIWLNLLTVSQNQKHFLNTGLPYKIEVNSEQASKVDQR